MSADTREAVWDTAAALERLASLARIDTTLLVTDFATRDPAVSGTLSRVEVLLTGWGCPPLTGRALARMPRLRAVIHAAGSVKHHLTAQAWERGLAVSTAAAANALPVAEFTLAAILFSGKRVLAGAHAYRIRRAQVDLLARFPDAGNYRRTVGVVGASLVGRRVLELLRGFDLDVLLHDPYVGAREARVLGAEAVALDELARRSDIVTLHAPELPSTHRMFDAARLSLLRDGATLVNTARGSLVDTEALTKELVAGRLHAVLDHTDPLVLPADSPLYDLPNVLLTPHLAGSLGRELGRLATSALDELDRYTRGEPFLHRVDPRTLAYSA
ncbi:hydroxyacid dehydrogenase [Streptomyces sp. CA-250714]|uniref:hydroxyacid dehydrogenase n=1 Tax=Streptomyces sp. CA-250714 TaxID=3240060 RepID=UPI003D945197